MDFVPFERIVVIGVGLIGSSITRGVRAHGLAKSVVICDGSPSALARAQELQLGDAYFSDPAEAVGGADLVILAVPVGACGLVAEQMAKGLTKGAIVSDVGSVKGAVVRLVKDHLPEGVHFVPAHPIAGTEYSGPDSGFAELFEGRWLIVTPEEGTPEPVVDRVRGLWRGLGSSIETMSPEHHDLVLAITSHLPHLIAYNIVGTADDLGHVTQSEVIKFSASGFRDFTRIAASDPTMWRDVFLNNKDAVLEMLARFNEDLAVLQRAIRWGDGDTLFEFFTRTRAIRKSIIQAGQDTAAPNFGRNK